MKHIYSFYYYHFNDNDTGNRKQNMVNGHQKALMKFSEKIIDMCGVATKRRTSNLSFTGLGSLLGIRHNTLCAVGQ